jgi:hypothetical protein
MFLAIDNAKRYIPAMNRFWSTSLAFAVLSFSGCGSHSGNHIDVDGGNLEASRQAALKTTVSCGDANCNPSVAMLVGTTSKSIEACSASLIDSDTLITNSHCIPDDLKIDGADCSSRIFVFFPADGGFGDERVECGTVLHASAISATEPAKYADYAFVRLKSPSTRPALKISYDGFPAATYHIDKVDPSIRNDTFSGSLQNTECTTLSADTVMEMGRDPATALVSFIHCHIEHGNSGSPILDDQNEIHGVIQAVMESVTASDATPAASSGYLDGLPDGAAYGTSLGCISFPGVLPDHPIYPACTLAATDADRSAVRAKMISALTTSLTASALAASGGKVSPDLDPIFEWTIGARKSDSAQTLVFFLAPKCIKPSAKFGAQSTGTIEAKIPYWTAQTGFDRNLDFGGRVDPASEGFYSSKIVFDPNLFGKTGMTPVEYTDDTSGATTPVVYFGDNIQVCPN